MCYNDSMTKITVAEAARRLGRNGQTIRDYIHYGWIKAEKWGRFWIIEESELEKVRDVRQGKRYITKS
jgi:excisionase family DNA binding protein